MSLSPSVGDTTNEGKKNHIDRSVFGSVSFMPCIDSSRADRATAIA